MSQFEKNKLIAKIHIAKNDLRLDDGSYRDILKRVTSKDSCKNMTENQLKAVINEFKKYGWKPKASQTTAKCYGTKPTASVELPSRQAIIDKVGTILADMDLHWNYVHAMSANMFGKLQLQFCTDDEMFKVMQALAVYQRRHRKNADK